MPQLLDWFQKNESLLWLTGAGSLAVLLITLVAAFALAVRMPADFFVAREKHHLRLFRGRPALRLTVAVFRNGLGAVFLLAGLAMLVLPGQGFLTILIGLVLVDFPGKLRLEAWLIRKRSVHTPINWIRRKFHRPPLILGEP